MTIEEAFSLVTNLDYKESHRRFTPQHGLLQFDRNGTVAGFKRFKSMPSEQEQHDTLTAIPGCVQIFTMPHWFETADALRERINKDLWLFQHMR